jgi:hypothetical protein
VIQAELSIIFERIQNKHIKKDARGNQFSNEITTPIDNEVKEVKLFPSI